ncbi:MAG: DUF4349 domain-containing protein [Planctomycetes bacterium]|nr:DUF4349 domain-containing protein [Planctomycetota bacterium]
MDCNEARLLIDERIQGLLPAAQDAALEDHLRLCPDCAQDLKHLMKVRELLAAARAELPPAGELDRIFHHLRREAGNAFAGAYAVSSPDHEGVHPMSAAVASTPLSLERARAAKRSRGTWKIVAVSMLCAAALMIVAYNVGTAQYGPSDRVVVTNLAKPGRGGRSEEAAHPVGTMAIPDSAFAAVSGEESKEGLLQDYTESDDSNSSKDKAYGGERPAPPSAPPPELAEAGRDEYEKSRAATAGVGGGGTSSGNGWFGGGDTPKPAAEGEYKKLGGQQQGEGAGGKFNSRGDSVKADEDTKGAPGDGEANIDRPKIIKTGELTVEVKNYGEAAARAETAMMKHGGFMADSRNADRPGGTKIGTLVIRVAPEKFEELFADLKKLGTVMQERAGGQDITAQYVDTEARILNLQVAEARLQELIKTKTWMDKVSSLLEVERELTRVRGQIESYQGQMRVWKDQISLSTIRLTLQEPERSVPGGHLGVEVPALEEAKKTLDGVLARIGGQVVSGQNSKRGDGTLIGDYTLRVKFGKFADLIGAVKMLGRTQDERVTNQPFGNAVPEGAEDVPCDISVRLGERSIQLPSGALSLEVQGIADGMKKLEPVLADAKAIIVSNQTQRQGDGSTTANITVRVPAGTFQQLADSLPGLGRVSQRTINGESGKVLGGAAEQPCNLSLYLFEPAKQVPSGSMTVEVPGFAAARDALTALVKEREVQVESATSRDNPDGTMSGTFLLGIRADKMDDTVKAIEGLGKVKVRQLTGLGLGELSNVDKDVIGKVQVVLAEKPALAPQEEGSFRLMLRDTFGGFLNSMGYIIRGLGMILPWLAIFGVVVLAAIRWSRRREAAALAAETSAKPSSGDAKPAESQSEKK